MDKLHEITFISSPDSEVERLAMMLKVTNDGFYEKKGFLIKSSPGNVNPESVVIIPKAEYGRMIGLWEELKKTKLQLPLQISSYTKSRLEKIAEVGVAEEILNNYQTQWKRAEKIFWEYLETFMTKELKLIKSIEVRVSNWGTVSSYRFLSRAIGQKLIIYVRTDVGIGHVAEAIVTSLLWPYRNERGLSWSKREAIVDYLLTREKLTKLWPDYHPTLSDTPRVSHRERVASQAYVRELGIPIMAEANLLPTLTREMSKKERVVFELIFNQSGEIVSFDEIADLLWGEGEFKTFWAINKVMQRIRIKLSKVDNVLKLETLRGRGYRLS